MRDTYIPQDHEIRAAVIIHRAPLIHRQMPGRTIRDAERAAIAEWEAWLAEHDARVAADALNAAADELALVNADGALIELAVKHGGYYAGVRHAYERDVERLRARATRLQEGQSDAATG